MITNIFIQARMSSSRFPGKVLATLHDKPLIKHIVDSAKQVSDVNKVAVLTSLEKSDDPLISYLGQISCDYFRGSLEDVFCRFQSALKVFPCDYFVRLCADSPFIDKNLINYMLKNIENKDDDIITNVMKRTFPKGQSVEIIKTNVFNKVDSSTLIKEETEHVFPYFYRNAHQFKICSIENIRDESYLNFCVDTLQDLERFSNFRPSFQFQDPIHVE